jgi:AGCS family alanine or glycine:cation symporter
LAATIGTGNIIGVSTAIALGGPGAVFWCWLTGLLGIATCYAECYLSVKYRQKREDGKQIGGPMYVLEYGIGKKGLAVLFAVSAILASLGMGSSVQAHSIRAALDGQLFVSPHLVGIAAGVLTGFVIVGGNRQIAKVCTWLVPLMSIFYLGGCLWIMAMNYKVLPSAIKTIVISAFSKKAVAGGCAGGGVLLAMRTGISRGLFTNEAGLGSIPMTAASADTKDSVQQALISMTGPFWDTVVMCAVTGVAVVSSILAKPESYVGIEPERLCFTAFSGLPFAGKEILSLSMILFAFATIIGWNVYGVTAVRYLFGDKGINTYQVLYMLAVYLGAVMSMELVWGISDLFNSLMAIPNLFCLWKLRNVIKFPKTRIVKSKKKV